MKQITLIKQFENDVNKHLAYLSGVFSLHEITAHLRKKNFFTPLDYKIHLKHLDSKTLSLSITCITPQVDKAMESALKKKSIITEELVEQHMSSIMLEYEQVLAYSIKDIVKQVSNIQVTPWQDISTFTLYRPRNQARSQDQSIHAVDTLTYYKRLVGLRLKGDYLQHNNFAPLLFWLLAQAIQKEISYTLEDAHPSFFVRSNTLFEPAHILHLSEYRVLKDIDFNDITSLLTNQLQALDGRAFIASVQNYTQQDFYHLSNGSIPMNSLFHNLQCLAGTEAWRSFTTKDNIKELLNNVTLSHGDYASDITLEDSIGSYLLK